MRKSTVSLVALLATMVSACDATPSADSPKQSITQRDVYNSLEDCVADWGDTELCERQMKEAREHAEKMAAAQGNSGSAAFMPIFFGPSYSGDTRSVVHNGRTVTPTTTKASRTANFVSRPGGGRVISYTAPRSPGTTTGFTATSRGGFGATGSIGSGG